MSTSSSRFSRLPNSTAKFLLAFLSMAFVLAAPGCQSNSHTSNPRLRKIDEMLATQLPKGTPQARVTFFLHSRGFTDEYSPDRSAIVAIVRLVDTDTLQPATARVTFHFDSFDKLTTYDMEAVSDSSTP